MQGHARSAMDTAADLAAWSRRRDEAAFARLVAAHAALVAAACRRQLGAGDDADEAAQAVFIILARKAGGIANPERLGPWLYGVALRVCLNARRSRTRRSRHEQEAAMIDRTQPPVAPETDELRGLLDQAIGALSPAQREVVVGHFLEGRSQVAMAGGLGISEDAVRMRLRYAVDRMREWFAARGMQVGTAALTACLTAEAGAAEPALVAACTRTALHPVAGSTAATLAGGTSGMAGALLAVGAVLLVAGSGFAAWRAFGGQPPPAAEPTPAVAPLATVFTGQADAGLERILALRLDARFRRDHLDEVLEDLRQRTGLRAFCPPPLASSFTITIEVEGITVRAVLELAAQAGGLTLELRGDRVVLWRTALDARLAGLQEQLRSGDADARISAAYGLSRLGDPRVYPVLFRTLDDADPRVARAALQLLRNHPVDMQDLAPLPVQRLAGLAVRDPRAWGDFEGACSILGTGLAFEQLRTLATAPEINRSYRGSAILTLGRTGDPRAVEVLVPLLANRESAFAAAAALVQLLETTKAPQAVEPLIAMVCSEASTRHGARHLAVQALGGSGDARAVEPLCGLLTDPDLSVRLAAAKSLGELRDQRAETALAAVLERTDPAQGAAEDALFRIRVPATVGGLAPQLEQADAKLRLRAVTALGMINDPATVPLLIARLGDSDPQVRWAAAIVLAKTRDPRGTAPLLALLDDPAPLPRPGILHLLASSRLPQVVDACVERLRSGSPEARADAVAALAQTRDPRALPHLTALLAEPNRQLRLDAVKALGTQRDAAVVETLLPLLADRDRRIRQAAANALCQVLDLRINDSQPISALVPQPGDNPRFGAVSCAQALAGTAGLDPRVREAIATWATAEAARTAGPPADAPTPAPAPERSDF